MKKTELKAELKISWKSIKIELQDKLNKVKTEKQMKTFVEDIFGGFLYTNKDEIKKSILASGLASESENELNLKPHTSSMSYVG